MTDSIKALGAGMDFLFLPYLICAAIAIVLGVWEYRRRSNAAARPDKIFIYLVFIALFMLGWRTLIPIASSRYFGNIIFVEILLAAAGICFLARRPEKIARWAALIGGVTIIVFAWGKDFRSREVRDYLPGMGEFLKNEYLRDAARSVVVDMTDNYKRLEYYSGYTVCPRSCERIDWTNEALTERRLFDLFREVFRGKRRLLLVTTEKTAAVPLAPLTKFCNANGFSVQKIYTAAYRKKLIEVYEITAGARHCGQTAAVAAGANPETSLLRNPCFTQQRPWTASERLAAGASGAAVRPAAWSLYHKDWTSATVVEMSDGGQDGIGFSDARDEYWQLYQELQLQPGRYRGFIVVKCVVVPLHFNIILQDGRNYFLPVSGSVEEANTAYEFRFDIDLEREFDGRFMAELYGSGFRVIRMALNKENK